MGSSSKDQKLLEAEKSKKLQGISQPINEGENMVAQRHLREEVCVRGMCF